MKPLASVALFLLLTGSVWAGDLQKAKLFYENRLLDDAKRELVEIVASSSNSNDVSSALHLLGTIAVEEKRYEAAIRSWSDLSTRFPGTRDAIEVQAKIPLVRNLMELDSPSATTGTGRGGIIVTGIGTETQFVNQTVTEFMNLLGSRGVTVSRAPAGVSSVPELLKRSDGDLIDGALVLALRFGYMESLRAACHDSDGRLLWEEKSSGSMGITKSGITEGLIRRLIRKVEPHIGGPCLPTAATPG